MNFDWKNENNCELLNYFLFTWLSILNIYFRPRLSGYYDLPKFLPKDSYVEIYVYFRCVLLPWLCVWVCVCVCVFVSVRYYFYCNLMSSEPRAASWSEELRSGFEQEVCINMRMLYVCVCVCVLVALGDFCASISAATGKTHHHQQLRQLPIAP